MNAPLISFCTAHLDRVEQLSQTLRPNLVIVESAAAEAEIVLLDLGTSEPFWQKLLSDFRTEIESGLLKAHRSLEPVGWHAAKAKNACHRLASGTVLVNLDADNFLEPGEPDEILRLFSEHRPDIFIQWTGTWGDGTFGRMAYPREVFNSLGGYDDGMEPMGGEDVDLVFRALQLFRGRPATMLHYTGWNFIEKTSPPRLPFIPADTRFITVPASAMSRALPNTRSDGMRRIEGPFRGGDHADWKAMNARNSERFLEKWRRGEFVNAGTKSALQTIDARQARSR